MQQATWIKSSRSFSNGNCVEAAELPDGHIGVRDSKSPHGPVLRFAPEEWNAFTAGIRNGEFDHLATTVSIPGLVPADRDPRAARRYPTAQA